MTTNDPIKADAREDVGASGTDRPNDTTEAP